MKLIDLLSGVDIIEMNAPENMEITDISFDSRKTEKGQLFVAISGYESDGHKFIGSAVKNGAAAVLCLSLIHI